VRSEEQEGEGLSIDSSSRDGIESLDRVRLDMMDSRPASLPTKSSSSNSSGGLSSRSNELLPSDRLYSFSETPVCSRIAFTVSLCSAPVRLRTLLFDFGGGIEVMAKSAATEGGIASGECTVRDRRSNLSDCFLPFWRRSVLVWDR
jgi:hypothetical protein